MAAKVPSHMRALVLEGPKHLAIQTIPTPEPKPNEALIAVEGCGVCGSNLPVWEGREWFRYPLAPGAPGHEGYGTIVALGRSVRDRHIGERVSFLSERAFAEYATARASGMCPLPSTLHDVPFPGEAFGCIANIFRRADVRPGDRVAVIGVGFLGAGLVALANRAGAHVTAISRRPFALRLAQKLGASLAVTAEDPALTEDSCDVVIEAVGAQRTLALASQLIAVHGRLVIAGYHQDGPRTVDMQTWNWKGIDVVNAHERADEVYVAGMRAALDAVATGALNPKLLVSHSFSLTDATAAFEALAARPEGFVKAVVTP